MTEEQAELLIGMVSDTYVAVFAVGVILAGIVLYMLLWKTR